MTPRIYADPAALADETAGAGWRILRRVLLYLMLVTAPWMLVIVTVRAIWS